MYNKIKKLKTISLTKFNSEGKLFIFSENSRIIVK